MEWWAWALITIGVIALGAVKLAFFNRIMRNEAAKRRFENED